VAGEDQQRRRDLFRRLRVGDVVDGTVAGLASYAAFVQIGDAPGEHLFGDGMIHVSELAPDRISRATDAVHLGQRVRVRVIGLEPDQNRIRLSLRDVPPI
jgi:small subunit ribosomal protein S1